MNYIFIAFANKKREKSWHRNYVWNYAEYDENIN
jgi:hypothetical protein